MQTSIVRHRPIRLTAFAIVLTTALPAMAKPVASGSFTLFGSSMSFDVHEDSHGTVSGDADFSVQPWLQFHTTINCYTYADANTVIFSGTVTSSNFPELVGATAVFAVRDNGEGRHQPRDQSIGVNFFYEPGTDCTNFAQVVESWGMTLQDLFFDIDGGNIQVRQRG